MTTLPVLLELQAIHDNLAVIERDLTAFPQEMASLDAEAKAQGKRVDALSKELADARSSQASLVRDLAQAQKLEDQARAAMKNATRKVHYTAAIRELDERERQKAAVAKPLKDVEARLAERTALRDKAREQFDELHKIFLAEHENQVVARDLALGRKRELEAQLGTVEVGRFNRLIQARHGQAVVVVENGACSGCRTKLRGPLLAQLREKTTLNCESCQRILYLPARP
jgi:predicted  nucleic acid-binding Zn-ribbon protein